MTGPLPDTTALKALAERLRQLDQTRGAFADAANRYNERLQSEREHGGFPPRLGDFPAIMDDARSAWFKSMQDFADEGLGGRGADAIAALLAIVETLTAELERVTAERDEADRRAGAAERRGADLADSLGTLTTWRDQQKRMAGDDTSVSFDKVWAEVLGRATAAEAEAARLRIAVTAARPIIESLIAAEHNVETWGLTGRLAAIDAALATQGGGS